MSLNEIQQSHAPAVSGDIGNFPETQQARSVSEPTPRPSLDASLARRRRRLDKWRGNLATGVVIITSAVGAVGAQSVFAKDETGPNIDPNCASPSPSQILESQMPSASLVVESPSGSIDVFVSPSPLTSEPPASPVGLPLAGSEPGQALVGDGVEPINPGASPTGKSWAEFLADGPDQFEVLGDVISQDDCEIRTISQPRLQRIIDTFWRNHSNELNNNSYRKPGDPHQFYSKKSVDRLISYVGKGTNWARYNAGKLVYVLARIAGDITYSPELRKQAAKKADVAYDAAISQLPQDQKVTGRNHINRVILGNIDFQLHPM